MTNCFEFMVQDKLNHSSWSASISDFHDCGLFFQMTVSARGSSLIILFGSSAFSRWLLLPQLDIGCSMADPEDLFWNTEKLSEHLNYPDTLSTVQAIAFLYRNELIHR